MFYCLGKKNPQRGVATTPPPIFEGLIFGGAYIRRGLSMEGNLRFKIDWVSLTIEGKFTVFALFYLVFGGNIPRTSPRGAYIWRGDLTEGFLHYRFGRFVMSFHNCWYPGLVIIIIILVHYIDHPSLHALFPVTFPKWLRTS